MASPVFTTIQKIKDWINNSAGSFDDDIIIGATIQQVSGMISAYLSRPNIFYNAYTEYYNGSGNEQLILRNYPVLSVSSVLVNNQTQQSSSNPTQYGYFLEPWGGDLPGHNQSLLSRGKPWCQGSANVMVSYNAGYAVLDEANTIPIAGNGLLPLCYSGSWGADIGITKNGVAMTKVASAPSAGQYAVAQGVYTFAAADAGSTILMSYSYVPPSIEQACIEIVGERFSTKTRIGQVSHAVGGAETVSFNMKKFNDYCEATLQPYKRMALLS